jgi:4-hydroxy-tetrahydrodipicolinate synthase
VNALKKLLVYIKDYKKECVLGPLFKLLEASFELIVPLMNIGFKGVISVLSNVMPAQTAAMTTLALEGKGAEANALQLKYLPFIQALFCETNPIPAKAAMAQLGLMENSLRLPLVPATAATEELLKQTLKDLF